MKKGCAKVSHDLDNTIKIPLAPFKKGGMAKSPPFVNWSLYTLDTVAMVTIGFVSTFSEPQNIEQGISNVEVTPS